MVFPNSTHKLKIIANRSQITEKTLNLETALDSILDFRKVKNCFGCGICTAICPVAELLPDHYNPRILLQSLPSGDEEILKSAELWLCAWCYRCYTRCPQSLSLPEIFLALRRFAVECGYLEGFYKALEIIRKNLPLLVSCCYVGFHPERVINNKQLVKEAIQHAIFTYEAEKRKEKLVTPVYRDKVAIIGSGPAGLSAAHYLAKKEYSVTIFEASSLPGGMLRMCIPEYRLPKKIVDFDIMCIKDLGVEIRTNVSIGKDLMLIELSKEYDALFIATGMHKGKKLGFEGEELKGVVDAIDFLREVNLGMKAELGDRVAVICVHRLLALDAARVALRLGPKEVNVIYRRSRKSMLCSERMGEQMQREVEKAEREGAKTHCMIWPTKILGKDGRVVGIECARMMLGKPDNRGRRRLEPINGSEFVMEVDSVILAVGQAPHFVTPREVEVTEGKTIKVDPFTLETSLPGVFAGGEVESGPSTAIASIAAGKRAAVSIDCYLRGYTLGPHNITEKSFWGKK